jgi:hypothetical protein
MKKFYLVVLVLFLSGISLFSQLNIGEVNDSVITEFQFCMIHPVRDSGIVKLHCSDGNGVMIYMEIREDIFEGKLNILITPSDDLGPITKEKTLNWFMLPEEE